jgi:integrase
MVLKALRVVEQRPAVETAHRIRQRMSDVFVFGIANGVCANDPAAIVRKALAPVVRGHQPAITNLAGLREVMRRAEAITAFPGTKLALRLLALTAVRSADLRGVEVAEFEGDEVTALGGNLWRIPPERIKKAREHLVPLSRQALEVIEEARKLVGRGKLLFPSTRHAHRPMSENAIGYLLNRAGYHGKHVPHGFRAAFSTIMNEKYRADRAIIDLMLSHSPDDKVEAAYNRALHMERRRELAQEWADMLTEGMPPVADLLIGPRR